jgi:nucleoside-diphosphate-sugar epimerase
MIIKRDIESLLNFGEKFRQLDQANVTILGGTGFIGLWILRAFEEYKKSLGIQINITIYTRDGKKAYSNLNKEFLSKFHIVEADFASKHEIVEKSDYFICASTPSRSSTGLGNSRNVFEITVNSTNSILLSANKFKNTPKVLNLSSGIVYGKQDIKIRNQKEGPRKLLCDSNQGYSNAKIRSEEIYEDGNKASAIKSISPRLFAFFGPGIDFNEHFAVGNFLRDGLNESKIKIKGNPNTIRSYMYPTDLVNWLLTSLINPINENVNIGSENPISMLDLARLISNKTSKRGVDVLLNSELASNYVPETKIFRNLYNVSELITLEDGLERWIEWHRLNT